MDKRALRREIGAKKSALTPMEIERRSGILAERFFETAQYRACRSLYAYCAFNQEVRTAPIIERAWADGKRVAVPKVIDNKMVFIWIDSLDALTPGYSGIPEPISDAPIADDACALVLMPGLAFDPQGHRIGYGGGFYDRFLEAEGPPPAEGPLPAEPHHPLVALCYDFQLYDHLDVEAHDVPVDLVITDGKNA